jgi:adenine-specific DNA glycosylase
LWNPPERSAETSIEAFLNSQGVRDSDITQIQYKEGFRHTFSHFHLDIEPIYIDLKKAPPMMVQESTQRWVQLTQLTEREEAIGLSAAALKPMQHATLRPLPPFRCSNDTHPELQPISKRTSGTGATTAAWSHGRADL